MNAPALLLDPVAAGAALGIGLLIGLERERHKGHGSQRKPAGLRTFTIAALIGHMAWLLGGQILLGIILLLTGVLLAIAYVKRHGTDPGITTELALLLTACLGAAAVGTPAEAAGMGVLLALLLSLRNRLHGLARQVLSQQEIHDGLIFAAAVLVILPLMPDRHVGPYAVLNPARIWEFAILLMAISVAGHIAVRVIGPRYGLAITGLISGFASSTATVAGMGVQARTQPTRLQASVGAALMSCVATLVQMGILLAAASQALFVKLLPALLFAALIVIMIGLYFVHRASGNDLTHVSASQRLFNLRMIVLLSLGIAGFSLLIAVVLSAAGENGVLMAAILSGFADAHAAALSVAGLQVDGKLTLTQAVWPILAMLTSNSVSKMVVARSGGSDYFRRMVGGLLLMLLALWLGAWITLQ